MIGKLAGIISTALMFIKPKIRKLVIGDGKMKTNEEKMNEESTKLYNNYTLEREQIEKEAKEKGLWIYGGLDSNQYLFKEVRTRVIKAEEKIREKYSKL